MTVKLSSLRVSAEMDASAYVKGATEKEAADKRIVQSSQSVGAALAAQDAAAGKSARSFESLSRAYIDGYAPAAKFEAAIKSLSNAMDRGLGADRAALILQGIEGKFGRTADAARLAAQGFTSLAPIAANLNRTMDAAGKGQEAFAKSAGLARHELINLGRQAQDVAVSIAGGQGLGTVLLQQGSQIADVFTSSRSSFAGFAAQVGRGAVGVVTSVAGITAGVTAIGAGLVYTGLQYAASQREVERSLASIGAASGATVASINAVAEATARQQRISIAAAREIASTYAGTGLKVGSLPGLVGATRDFAAQTGQSDLNAAAEELGKAFADPVKGAEALSAKLGFLDGRTLGFIRTAANANDKLAAQRVLLDALRPSIDGAADRVSFFTRQWERLKNAASDAVDVVGKKLNGPSAQEQLAGVNVRLGSLDSGAASNPLFRSGLEAQRRLLLAERDRLEGQLRIETETATFKQAAADRRALSLEVEGFAKGFDPFLEQAREAERQLVKIRKLLSTPEGQGSVENLAVIQRYLEALATAQQTRLSVDQRIRAEAELQVRQTLARTLAEQTAVALDRERLTMAGQIVSEKEREARLQAQIAQTQAQAIREARDNLRSANDNAALAGLLPYQAQRLQIEQRYRDLNQRTSGAAIAPADGYAGYGPFRIPAAGAAAVASSAASGLEPGFAAKVKALIEAVGDSGATLTSGFRSREKQQELYDRYGPGRAAAPGSSQHERGTASDFTFSSPAARARAMELAPQFGLRALPSNGGAVHFDVGSVNASTAALSNNAAAMNSVAKARELAALDENTINAALRRSAMELTNQSQLLTLQEQAFSRSAFAIGKAAKEQELINGFVQQGVPITDNLRKRISDLADGYGSLAERSAGVRLRDDIGFERQQLFRSDSERAIAAQFRGTGIGLDSVEAGAKRMNAYLEKGIDLASGFSNELAQGFLRGKNATEVLKGALQNLTSQLLTLAVNQTVRGLFGGLFGGAAAGGEVNGSIFDLFAAPSIAGPFANGGVFKGGNVVPFANGGVITGPTLFPLVGGKTGLAGEAGTEAILPLRRGRGGALGVMATENRAAAPAAPVFNINVVGATGNEEVKRMVYAGQQQALAEYDRTSQRRQANARFRS